MGDSTFIYICLLEITERVKLNLRATVTYPFCLFCISAIHIFGTDQKL